MRKIYNFINGIEVLHLIGKIGTFPWILNIYLILANYINLWKLVDNMTFLINKITGSRYIWESWGRGRRNLRSNQYS